MIGFIHYMKPANLKTKLFLDSGDPEDTKKMLGVLGFLDGQTTNPSLVAKKLTASGTALKLTSDGLLFEYRKIIEQISALIPNGSVSVEVYADKTTTAETMIAQGKEMFAWIPNAHIKFPTTTAGLTAAQNAVSQGLRVNMTLVFTIEQAAAVYAATKGAKRGDVFISPFIGRLDDKGENGMDLIKNIAELYKAGDGHVEILSASVRNMNHFMGSIANHADIITCPMSVLTEWKDDGMHVPDAAFIYGKAELTPIPYKPLDLTKPWDSFDISHPLTDTGLAKFASDWNALLA